MVAPKLRFKDFDGDWSKNTIQSFMDNNYILDQMDGNHGELYPKAEEFSISGVPYISATDFSNGEVDFSSCKKLPVQRAKLFKKGIARNGDVLFAHNATVGPVALLKTDLDFVILSTTATYYRCNHQFLSNQYLKNYFASDYFVQQYFGIMSQSTRNQVPITTQRKLSISIPSLEEQTKIASFLSAVDEKISQLSQKLHLLGQYKQGMMQKLFSQQIRFKADDGSDFGEWKENKFGECINVFDNLRKPISASERIAGNTPYYGANGIQSYIDGYTHDGEFILIAEDGANDLINYPIQYVNGKIWVNNHAHVVSGHHEKIQNKFLKYRLKSIDFTKYLVGGGRAKLNAGAMKEISFSAPCLEEQTKIADFLSSIDQKIDVVSEQLEQAKLWKKGLLQQMFV